MAVQKGSSTAHRLAEWKALSLVENWVASKVSTMAAKLVVWLVCLLVETTEKKLVDSLEMRTVGKKAGLKDSKLVER